MELKYKKILLLVSGMSPQIITETLYALITQPEPWVPDTIHLITTEIGKNNAVLQLLNGEKYFARLLHDYAVTKHIAFDESCIHLIEKNGQVLSDLRTPSDNEAAADFISEKIRHFTQDDSTELHVSLAGGRKTMGFYMGYALSLYGRAQDKLSHVLVSDKYESNPQFFYPTPITKVISDRNGSPLDASKAEVWLAEIPFVRMRSSLPESLLLHAKSFSETVNLVRLANESPVLKLLPKQQKIMLNGVSAKLSPVHMTFMLWIANANEPIKPLVDGESSLDYKNDFLSAAEKYWLEVTSRTTDSIAKGMTKDFMQINISRLNKELRKGFGEALANRCKLASRKTKQGKGYALPSDISVEIE